MINTLWQASRLLSDSSTIYSDRHRMANHEVIIKGIIVWARMPEWAPFYAYLDLVPFLYNPEVLVSSQKVAVSMSF